MSDFLDDRRKALEEQFFAKENAKLLEKMKKKEEEAESRDDLRAASGITDENVLDHLMELNIRSETLAALSLIPLVQVAWADGKVQKQERTAILKAATEKGIAQGTPGYGLLETWLNHQPQAAFINVWKDYIQALSKNLTDDARNALKTDVLGRAREVAEAAGGFLGLGNKVSSDEQNVLDELGRAFEA